MTQACRTSALSITMTDECFVVCKEAAPWGWVVMLARETLIRPVLLQLLLLSKSEWHLGKVSATTWSELALRWCMIGSNGGEGPTAAHHPATWLMGHCLYQPSTLAPPLIRKKEGQCKSERWSKGASSQKTGERRRNKQLKQVMGFTYQVPLFFPSVRVFLEALWKHTDAAINLQNQLFTEE